jgi:hypothetical protein
MSLLTPAVDGDSADRQGAERCYILSLVYLTSHGSRRLPGPLVTDGQSQFLVYTGKRTCAQVHLLPFSDMRHLDAGLNPGTPACKADALNSHAQSITGPI